MRRRGLLLWLLLLALAPLAHAADVHAFLDRNHVSLGDTVTLNIESTGALGTPDLAPLQQDFQVLGSSRSSSMAITNGTATATSQIGIALKPLHAGTLVIPPLSVGGAMTPLLTLQVGAAPAGGVGTPGDPVFMQAEVSSSSPYVGQQVVYTVRLFYLPGVDGALSNPVADGARLVKLDRDHSYMTERDGFAYKVIEYSFALIPQRSGAITVQGPQFQGQRLAVGNSGAVPINPNVLFNNPQALLNGQMPGITQPANATAPSVQLQVRAAPPSAGKPWLPARSVQLKLDGIPADGKLVAGAPLTLTLSISASGQPADALPEPQLPAIAGAHVYPDQTRDSTDDTGEWLVGTRTRSFAIVPERNGTLAIPAITLDWWNDVRDQAEQARVPAHTLTVSGVTAPTPSAARTGGPAPAATAAPASSAATAAATTPAWRVLALVALALWVLAIIAALVWWALRRRAARHLASRRTADAPDATARVPAPRAAVNRGAVPARPSTTTTARVLQQRALGAAHAGDAGACDHALLAWANALHPGIVSLGALRDALADPAQRDALDALQRTRWQGGDAAAACAAVAHAFARGLAWRADDKPGDDKPPDLPPLYPSR